MGMPSVRVAELYPALGLFKVSGWQIFVLRQWYVQWPGGKILSFIRVVSSVRCPGGRNLSCVRGMSSGLEENSVLLQGYVQWPGGRTLSCVRGMSSVRMAELFPPSGICLVALSQNSVPLHGVSVFFVAELYPALGVSPVSGWKREGYRNRETARFFNVDELNIRLWRKNKTNFENCYRRYSADRRGKPHWPELEEEINKKDFKRRTLGN
ncbi:uncharacterized protein TNCV_3712041 [Trichonephila clavipes]|uniref:Uncharacterized protein n=1 Tax=Trichonephila clavipes TaxID=2585209 RepID=A0A8X6RHZ2_TRICX|nr:uncharacterized protein TNCV_3712041 [Trichonephila clavipes]